MDNDLPSGSNNWRGWIDAQVTNLREDMRILKGKVETLEGDMAESRGRRLSLSTSIALATATAVIGACVAWVIPRPLSPETVELKATMERLIKNLQERPVDRPMQTEDRR